MKSMIQWAFVAMLGIAVLAGCVKTGSVVEQQPLAQKLPKTATVGVIVKVMNPEWQADADHLKEGLHHELAAHGWKYGDNPDFMFEVTVVDFDKGSKGARMFNAGGEAELHADVVLKTRDGAIAAKLGVMGNSKRQSSTTVGGYNTSWADSLPARAVRATIEQISEYLQSRG
ncbi:MAG: hypothetical protein JWP87_1704 [Labilithrix sp.]|nr:hypothetical protein [Labilithrix sp.]